MVDDITRAPVDPLREAAGAVIASADRHEVGLPSEASLDRLRAALASSASPAAPDPMTVTHVCPSCGRPTHTVDGPVASPAASRPEGPNHDGHTPHDPPAYLYDAALIVVSTYRGGTGAPTEATLSARALAVARLEAVLHDMERPAAAPRPEGPWAAAECPYCGEKVGPEHDARPSAHPDRLREIVSDSLAATTEGTDYAEAPEWSDEPGSHYVLRLTNEILARLPAAPRPEGLDAPPHELTGAQVDAAYRMIASANELALAVERYNYVIPPQLTASIAELLIVVDDFEELEEIHG